MSKEISPWKIIVDKREPRDVIDLFSNICPVRFELRNLQSADFALYYHDIGVVGIERKSLNDFFESIKDNRLFLQTDRMKDAYEVNFLAISGVLSDDMYRENMTPNTLMGAIASVIVRRRFNLIWFDNDDNLVDCVIYLFLKVTEGKYDDIGVKRNMSTLFKQMQHYTLLKIPFMTNKMANELLSRFGTLDEIRNTSDEELKEIRGIGEKRVKILKEALRNVNG